MKRFYKFLMPLVAIVAMALPWNVQAQNLSQYTVSTDTTTFVSIVSTGTEMTFSTEDDGYASATLPFAFSFGETTFPAGAPIALSANGFIYLGVSSTSGTTASSTGNYCAINPILRQDAHIGRYSGSGAYTLYDAEEETFTIEYQQLGAYSSPYGSYTYQVILHSNGNIEVIYDTIDLGGASSRTLATFFMAASDDALFLTGDWAAPVAATAYATRPITNLPAPGLRYTIVPPTDFCGRVSNLHVSAIDAFSITVCWSDANNSNWVVRIDSTEAGTPEDAFDTTFTFEDLNPYTSYTIRVASLCPSGDTSGWRVITTTTPCLPLDSIPYTYGFEGAATGSSSSSAFDAPCWTRVVNTTSYYPYISSTSTYCHSGTRGLYWYASSSYDQILVLPAVNTEETPINTLQVKFWAKASSTSYHPVFQIGVMTDPNDPNTFTQVGEINVEGTTWTEYASYLSTYNGTGSFVAVRSHMPSSSWYAYVDDFTLDFMPSCPHPVDLVVDSIGVEDIFVHWTAVGEESSWAVTLNGIAVDDAVDTFYHFENLTLNTMYTITVAASCDNDETSEAISLNVRTLAGDPISEFPFICTFENAEQNLVWVLENNTPNGWYIGTAASNGDGTGLYISNDNGVSNTYTNTTSCVSYAYVTFQLDAGEYAFSFDWKANGESSWDFLRAAIAPYGTATPNDGWSSTSVAPGFTVLDGGYMNLQTTWQNHSGVFTVTTPGVYNFYLVWRNDGSSGSNPPAAVDNFQLIRNVCAAPQNVIADDITPTSITVHWTPGGEETSWNLYVNGTVIENITDTFYTITDLEQYTLYSIAAQAICDDDDLSLTSEALSVRTTVSCPWPTQMTAVVNGADSVLVTWSGDQDEFQLVYGPAGFNPSTVNPDNYITINNALSYQITGLNAGLYSVYVRANCGGTEGISAWSEANFGLGYVNIDQVDTLHTCGAIICDNGGPEANYTGNRNDQVVVYPANPTEGLWITGTSHTEGSYDYVRIYEGVGTTGNILWQDNTSGVSTELTIEPFLVEGPVTITFHSDGSVYYAGFQIGVSCVHLSDCPTPSGLQMANVSNLTADAQWVNNSAYSNVTLLWGTVNDVTMATDSITLTGATSYTLTGLNGSTRYYVWLRGNCPEEASRMVTTTFVTTPDCMPVENLVVAGVDYHAFALNWDAPSAGYPTTQYVVSWKKSTAAAWTSDTVSTLYHYIDGLDLGTIYNYRVTSICDSVLSVASSGSVQTTGCGRLITDGGTTNSYLPTYQYYGYSYTQQIYLANELNGVDSIAKVSFYTTGNADGRSAVLYLGNTSKSYFTGTSDYIPVTSLTQVASTTLNGTGWITINLTTPFVRNADSNLVVVLDDNTGSYTSTIAWAATQTSTPRAIYFYQDGTNIEPSSPDASSKNTQNYVNQILIAAPTCVTPACAAPIIMVSNVGNNNINITWNTEDGASYEVAYRMAGTNNWTVFNAANTTGVCNITGLTPSADWDIRVSLVCEDDTLVATRTIATACGAAALPLTEDFQLRAYGNYDRTCWTTGSVNLGTTYPYPYVTSLSGAADNKLCLFYNGGYMVLPKVNAPLDSLQIRFRLTQGGANVRFLMGLVANPTDPINSMYRLDTLIRTEYDTVEQTVDITYEFAGLDPAYNHYHIAFWDAFNDNYSFLDNIVVEYVPNCRPATGLNVTTTTTTATITWQNAGAGATSHYVEYGPRNFTPGTGIIVAAPGTSATITGLTHSTSYDAYVYTVCGTTDTSIASQVVRFATECNAITALPYTQDFENIMAPGSSATNVQPNCWVAESTVGTEPHIMYSSTASYIGTPTHCYYFYNNGVVALPEVSVPLNQLMISFRDYNSAPQGYGLIIGTVDSVTPGFSASFQPIDTVIFEDGISNVFNVVSYLVNYTGTANRLAIKNFNTLSSLTYAYHYIDDLTIDYAPSCIPARNVHATMLLDNSATVAWSGSNNGSYTVTYGVHGTTATNTVTVTGTSATLTGLTANTTYDVRVSATCDTNARSYSFTTTCVPVALPFSEDFDTLTTSTTTATGVFPTCWSYKMTGSETYQGSTYVPQLYYSSTYAHSGSYSLRLYGVGYTKLPPMPASLDTLQLTFWDYTTSAYYGLEVGVMEGDNFIPVEVLATPASTHVEYEINFDSYHGNSRTIAFRNYYTSSNTTYYSYHYIDNINVDYVPSCRRINDMHDVSSSTTSINVDWTDRTPATRWQIEYGPKGHVFGSAAGTLITVSNHPTTISGLDTLAAYDFYVRAICTPGDTAEWSQKVTLSTSICDNTVAASTGVRNGTSYYAPLNNYYNYTLTETIIDSAELVGIGDITAIAYEYAHASASTSKTNVTIWLQPTNKRTFSSENDMVALDTSIAVRVYQGNLNCMQGWNYFAFSNPYVWNGHSNLLVIVDDNSGDYDGSSYVFGTASCSGYKTITYYSDSDNPNALTPGNFGGNTSYYQYRPAMKLVSCGAVCRTPEIDTVTVTETTATVTFTGTADDYEVAIVEGAWNEPSNGTLISGQTYTFNGLTPNTRYVVGVRAACGDDFYSEWYTMNCLTDAHVCAVPTDLVATNVTLTSATLGWTNGEEGQDAWQIAISGTGMNDTIDVTTNPYTISNLSYGVTYTFSVRAVCTGENYSEWSAPQTFTTLTCQTVTGVTVSDVTTNSAVISWTAPAGATNFEVEYGPQGFQQGTGTRRTVNDATTYTITGLADNSFFDAYVRTICGEGVASDWSTAATIHTAEVGIDDVVNANVNLYPNPASSTVTLTGIEGMATVTVVDMNGRESGKWTVTDGTLTIDVTEMAQGAYFVRIVGEQVNVIRKLIVR